MSLPVCVSCVVRVCVCVCVCVCATAAFGAAGQRCMALSTVVLVGEAKSWSQDLVDLARGLKVSAGLHRT